MRPGSYSYPQQNGNRELLHSGRFAKPVHNPRDGAAGKIPSNTSPRAYAGQEYGVPYHASVCADDEERSNRDKHQRDSDDKAQPMKTARHSVHGASLLFAATTCLFPRPPARGDAAMALASFTLMLWALVRGLAYGR